MCIWALGVSGEMSLLSSDNKINYSRAENQEKVTLNLKPEQNFEQQKMLFNVDKNLQRSADANRCPITVLWINFLRCKTIVLPFNFMQEIRWKISDLEETGGKGFVFP